MQGGAPGSFTSSLGAARVATAAPVEATVEDIITTIQLKKNAKKRNECTAVVRNNFDTFQAGGKICSSTSTQKL